MQVITAEPLSEFLDAVRSPVTKKKYMGKLKGFFDYESAKGNVKGDTFELRVAFFASEAKKDEAWATNVVNDYLRYQRERAENKVISPNTVPNFYKPIKLFCQQNDIELNWKKIAKRLPQVREYADDRKPSLEEILKLLQYPDRRVKPIVLTMLSGGIRVGAWDYLKVGDIVPLKEGEVVAAAKLTVYHGEREQYFTFITPEAYTSVQEYLDFRKSRGEDVNEKSWLIRNLFIPDKGAKTGFIDKEKKEKGGMKGDPLLPIHLKSTGVKRLIEDAWKWTGVRKNLEEGKRRHEFEALHGFRKYHESVCVNADMKVINIKLLRGDRIGLENSYYRPGEKELLEDYKRAIPQLTITKSKTTFSENEMELKMYKTLVETGSIDLTNESVRTILSERLKLEKLSDEDCQDKARVEKWSNLLREKLGFSEYELSPDIWANMNQEPLIKSAKTAQVYPKGRQKIIEEAELQKHMDDGFEYVSTLPSGKIVVKKA